MNAENLRFLPPIDSLRATSASEIGRMLLPIIREQTRVNAHGFVARDLARAIATSKYRTDQDEAGRLIMEGLSSLERSGLLVENPFQMMGSPWYTLSRSGNAALQTSGMYSGAVASEESRRLLHPSIADEALGDFERGRYDVAVNLAFRRLEIAVREASGLNEHGRDLFIAAMGVRGKSERQPLTPEPIDSSEAVAIRELFCGAYGAFRNPSAHRRIDYTDESQVFRLLITASALMYILDELCSAAAPLS